MGKTIIINERISNSPLLKEGILFHELPEDIRTALKDNKTSLGASSAFPDEYGDSFDTKLTLSRFKETKKRLEVIGEIEECDDIENAMTILIEKCKKLEAPIKENLEKIAYNFIVNLFNIPEEGVNFSVELKEDLSDISLGVRMQSEDSNFEFETSAHKKGLNDDIRKRRVINALMTGASLRIASEIRRYIADIYDLEPRLPDLYRKILALNDYLLFTNANELTEDSNNQLGMSKIIMGDKQTKTDVIVEAVIFPILIYEEVRAFLELCAAHGLPKSKDEANYVLKKSDYLQAEPWDMRLGPAMWDYLKKAFGDINESLLPYIFKEVCKLTPQRFNTFMQEIFSESKKSKKIAQNIIKYCKEKQEYDDFEGRMMSKRADFAAINEEYINPEEL